jgi:hypothetical protein
VGKSLTTAAEMFMPPALRGGFTALMKSFGGNNGAKLPQVAADTDELKAEVEVKSKALVGEKTPPPTYGNPATTGTSAAETQVEKAKERQTEATAETNSAYTEWLAAVARTSNLAKVYENAEKKLQPDDPALIKAKQEYDTALTQQDELYSKYVETRKKVSPDTSSPTSQERKSVGTRVTEAPGNLWKSLTKDRGTPPPPTDSGA